MYICIYNIIILRIWNSTVLVWLNATDCSCGTWSQKVWCLFKALNHCATIGCKIPMENYECVTKGATAQLLVNYKL